MYRDETSKTLLILCAFSNTDLLDVLCRVASSRRTSTRPCSSAMPWRRAPCRSTPRLHEDPTTSPSRESGTPVRIYSLPLIANPCDKRAALLLGRIVFLALRCGRNMMQACLFMKDCPPPDSADEEDHSLVLFFLAGIGTQGIPNSILMMTKTKSTVINLPSASYTMG